MSAKAEKQRQQLQLLELVYDKTQGNETKLVDVWDLGRELGWDLPTTAEVAQYLVGEGFIEFSATGDTLRMKTPGVQQIKDASARINWLHISDLHISAEGYDRRIVLDALLEDVRSRADRISASLEKIDIVFVTGDLVFGGHEEEYEIAYAELIEPLTRELQIAHLSQQVFLVPGNHDVDRSQIGFVARAIRDGIKNQNDVRDLLLDDREMEILLRHQRAYFAFFSDTFDGINLVSPANHYVQRVHIPGRGDIAIIGLNSAWLSQEDQERGKLILGEPQVETALSRAADANLIICLLHHPFEWFNDENPDTARCKSQLIRECDVILFGHSHDPNLISATYLEGEAIFIPAGSVFTDRGAQLTCNYVSLDLDSGEGTVFFRCYSDRRREWVKDIELTGDDANGKRPFSIQPLQLVGKPSVVEIVRPKPVLEDEEDGFLDWAVGAMDAAKELTELMQRVGPMTEAVTTKMDASTERIRWAGNDPRVMQMIVRKMAADIDEFASDMNGLSIEMQSGWERFFKSFKPFLSLESDDIARFIADSGDPTSYVEQAIEMADTLETVSGQINALKKGVIGARSSTTQLRGVNRDLNKAVRRVDQAFGRFLDMLDQMRMDMNSLAEMSRALPAALETRSTALEADSVEQGHGMSD